MSFRVYGMDTCFYNSIVRYPFEVRCEMLAELGFDATYLTAWSEQAWRDITKLPTVKQKYDLDVAAVYGVLDLAGADAAEMNRKVTGLVETLEGCRTIELAIKSSAPRIKSSDPSGDEAALHWLEKALAICDRRGIQILLYPHINFWLERLEDAVRLCKRLNHPSLGAVFCGFHWYAVDGKDLFTRFDEAGPFLRQANLCGSRRDPNGVGDKATIEPLDDGEMDNFAVLGGLQKINFDGLIGFQGYSVGGDPFGKLKRSLDAFRQLEARLKSHDNWLQLP